MNLEQLRKSFSQMTDDELAEIIHASRNAREKPVEKVKGKGKGGGKKTSPATNLSADQILALLEELGD